jgi:hypothetical protein
MPKKQIKDKKLYRELRTRGESKTNSARIAKAPALSARSKAAAKGGKHGTYDNWTKNDLLKRAKKVGIKGRSSMKKNQLITALRHY